MPVSKAFPDIVKKYRLQQGVTHEALADAAGIDRTYISLIERRLRTPTLDVAERIARALGKPLSALIAEAEVLEGNPDDAK